MEKLKMNTTSGEEVSTAITSMINAPEKYAYFEQRGLIEWTVCEYTLDLKDRKLYYSKEQLGYYYTFLYFEKGAIYIKWFNKKITLMQDMGLINMNHVRFTNQQNRENCQPDPKRLMEMITLVHFKSGFVFLAAGYGLAFVAFCVKLIQNHIEKKDESFNESNETKPKRIEVKEADETKPNPIEAKKLVKLNQNAMKSKKLMRLNQNANTRSFTISYSTTFK